MFFKGQRDSVYVHPLVAWEILIVAYMVVDQKASSQHGIHGENPGTHVSLTGLNPKP